MAIIVSRNGKNAQKVESTEFGLEDHLQGYVCTNPECLPLYEIDENIRLLILAREYPTDSGPIDALGVDREGHLYIIETKLYRNPDKRLVVAQVMDYGASLWKRTVDFAEFTAYLEDAVAGKFGVGLHEKLRDFFGVNDEDVPAMMDNLRANLAGGRFRFVVLMDRLHDRLKDLIVFINQNSQFTIYGIELEFYRHDEYEILIPRLFGAEVKKKTAADGAQRKRWDETTFFNAVEQSLGAGGRAVVGRFYDCLKRHAPIVWGSGVGCGSANARFPGRDGSVFTIYSDGKLSIYAGCMVPTEIAAFENASGLDFASCFGDKWKNFAFSMWAGMADAVVLAVEQFAAQARVIR